MDYFLKLHSTFDWGSFLAFDMTHTTMRVRTKVLLGMGGYFSPKFKLYL